MFGTNHPDIQLFASAPPGPDPVRASIQAFAAEPAQIDLAAPPPNPWG